MIAGLGIVVIVGLYIALDKYRKARRKRMTNVIPFPKKPARKSFDHW